MTSKTVVLAVVGGLVIFGVMLVAGSFCLLMTDRAVPGEVWTVLGAVLGGLTGLLVSTRSTVTNGERDPSAANPITITGGAPK